MITTTSNHNKLLFISLLLATSLLLTSADVEEYFVHVYSVSTSPTQLGLQTSSNEGGAYLYIKGDGFSARSPLSNQVTLINDQENAQVYCPIIEYLTTTTQVVCQIPPAPIPNKFYQVKVQADTSGDKSSIATCYNCRVQYDYWSTPYLAYMIPNAANPGSIINYYGIQRVADSSLVDYVKIGGNRCDANDIDEFESTAFHSNAYRTGSCAVTNQEAGYYNVSQLNKGSTGSAKLMNTIPTFRFNENAYGFVVVPKITSISNNLGSSQGQIITVLGEGFSSTKGQNEVKLGDANCAIISESQTEIKCELEARATPIPEQGYHAGLKIEFYGDVDGLSSVQDGSASPDWVKSHLSAESPRDLGNDYITKTSGYFKAPVSGDYKFVMTADFRAEFYMTTTPGSKTGLEKRIDIEDPIQYKFFYADRASSQTSEVMSLVEGNYYYMEIFHEVLSNGYTTLGMYVPNTQSSVNTRPEVQSIKITCPTDHEIIKFTLSNVNGGNWNIVFKGLSDDGKRVIRTSTSSNMPYNTSPTNVEDQIRWSIGYKTSVERQMLKADGSSTSDPSQANTFIYLITFIGFRQKEALPTIGSAGLTGSNVQTNVEVTQTPSNPLRGTFRITRNGKTVNPDYNANTYYMGEHMKTLGFTDPVLVENSGDYDLGAEWRFQFTGEGTNAIDPLEVSTSGLSGCKNPADIQIQLTVLQESSNDLFYEVIPVDFLYTEEEGPQITVKSNGITGNCPEFNCGYEVKSSGVPEIVSHSFSAPTLTLGIEGVTQNEYVLSDILVSFANTKCTVTNYIDSGSPATITAECLAPEAGDYYPRVHFNGLGYAKVANGVNKLTVNAGISGVSPNQINPNGGTLLTITGTGFPSSLEIAEKRGMKAELGSSLCKLTQVSYNEVKCITGPVGSNSPVTITLNEQTPESTILSLLNDYPTMSSVTPDAVNPVLQTEITIEGDNFDLDTANTKVYLEDEDGIRVTECLPLTSSVSQITCGLLGAPTGEYIIYVETSLGYSNSLPFTVKISVTSISPTSGSNAGGTTLTIVGGTFSTLKTQTLVFIGENNIPCDVMSSTANEIQCITQAKHSTYEETPQPIYVDTRIVEESVCDGTCEFTYLASLTPHISSISKNTAAPGDSITVTGSNLESIPSSSPPIVTINGNSCTVTANSDSSITFTIPSDTIPDDNAILLVNVPGKGNAESSSNLSKLPIKFSITDSSPTSGPSAGVILTLTGSGFQPGTSVQVGSSPCLIRSLTSTAITCRATSSGQITASYKTQTGVTCSGGGSCGSLSLSGSNNPTITSVSPLTPTVVSNSFSLTIQGTQLGATTPIVNLISQDDQTLLFTGSTSTSSSTQIEVSFTEVPAGSYKVEVVVSGSNIASITGNIVNVPLSASTGGSPLQNSLAGGATLIVTGSGFFDNSRKELNKVTVCGFPCKVTQSSANSIECETPAFINSHVEAAYPKLATTKKGIFKGATWSDAGNEKVLFDSIFNSVYVSSSLSCQVGMDLGAGLLGRLTEIRYFPDPAVQTPSILEGTIIEGSNNGIDYTEIVTLDMNANAGWNTIDLSQETVVYRYYRVKGGSSTAKCGLAELQFRGVVISSNEEDDLNAVECKASVTVNDKSVETSEIAVNYREDLTATVNSITPDMGTTDGGIDVVIEGTGFSNDPNEVKVEIDGVECSVNSANNTHIECTTGQAPPISNRRSSLESDLKVWVDGKGSAVVGAEVKYLYVDRWSSVNTWGGLPAPRKGESVSIPTGQTVLLDVSPPKLGAIIIEGALIFEDKEMELHCDYIIVNNGRLQIGTREKPLLSKVTVTLYGTKESPQLPIFGNKVIAAMNSVLDIHGKERSHTWTVLDSTANKGVTSITVKGEVDWQVGERIIIASTDHDHYQSEARTIESASVGSEVTTLGFVEPLKHLHYAGEQTVDSQTYDMRAEVGLLSRNVVIQGDEETSEKNLYGVQVMSHSNTGDDGGIARISYTEVRRAGQAFQLGKYPIHLHMMGNVRESYILGNSIHHSYNRAVTIHGVHHLLVKNNVAHWVMGHTIFIEDGIETHNTIEDNLVINTMSSSSLLNTDQTPASFWVTNPNNILRNNHAAGSDRYGFWYSLSKHPSGPSATDTICPNGEPMGEFYNNQAHSNGRYGLRVFDTFIPRKYPCQPPTPYSQNPPVPAEFTDFFGWKNRRNAVIGEALGAITFRNIKAADNLRAGIEISNSNFSPAGTLLVENAWIVGRTPENGYPMAYYGLNLVRGLVTPRSDNLYVKNVRFANFGDGMAAIETCSHCEFADSTDAGARTTFFSGLSFNSVTQKVRFNAPYKEILVDEDGTLTDNTLGGKGVVTYFYEHLDVPGCVRNEAVYNGLVCNEDVTIRRIEFVDSDPMDSFQGQPLIIFNRDYNPTNLYGTINFTGINMGWAAPFVTNYNYGLSWGSRADYIGLRINPSEVIRENDHTMTLIFNHSEYREEFTMRGLWSDTWINNVTELWENPVDNAPDSGTWYHDVPGQFLHVAINGKNKEDLHVDAVKCRLNCPDPNNPVPKEDMVRLWSNVSQWPNGEVPQDGDDVEIPADWVVKLDVNTNKLGTLEIKGDLYFDSTKDDLVLTAERIWVQGQMFIGNSTSDRYLKNAKVLLTGVRNSKDLLIGPVQDASNKVLAVTGNLTIFGAMTNHVYLRLLQPVNPGATSIVVDPTVDWKVGDDIVLAPSQLKNYEYEVRTITAVNSGGVLEFEEPLEFFHYGGSGITKSTPQGNLDMRTEVGLLSRNIKIEGTDEDYWGGRVYVGEIYDEERDVYVRGRVDMDGVEMKNLGQPNTTLAGFTFDTLSTANNGESVVRRCVMRESLGYELRIIASNGIRIENNLFFRAYKYQVTFEGLNQQIVFKQNLLVACLNREFSENPLNNMVDLVANLQVMADFWETEISENIMAGCAAHCLLGTANSCSNNIPIVFKDNTAHSGDVGWALIENGGGCTKVNYLTVYKMNIAIVSFRIFGTIRSENLIISDCLIGVSTNTGGILDDTTITLKNSYFAGVSLGNPDYYPNKAECSKNAAVYVPYSQIKEKTIPPNKPEQPWQKPTRDLIWKASFEVTGVTFENFGDNIVPGCVRNVLFATNPDAADGSAGTKVSSLTLLNVDQDNRVYFNKAKDFWISIEDCGNWACTGIKNILIQDVDGSLNGGVPMAMFPYNAGIMDPATCQASNVQNALFCTTVGWGVLTFDSLDADKNTRLISPVNVTTADGTFQNDLNSYMDNNWNGFYTSLERLSRFHSVVQAGKDYIILFTGTIASAMRWQLQASFPTNSITAQFRYTQSQAVRVTDINKNVIDQKIIRSDVANTILASDPCGTNTFNVETQSLTIKLTGAEDCLVYTNLVNSVQLSVRYNIPLNEFFAQNGATTFIDRIAAILNINPASIRIVQIKSGSTIIESYIDSSNQGETQEDTLEAQQEIQSNIVKLNEAAANGDLVILGSEVLNFSFVANFAHPEHIQTETISSSVSVAIIVIVSVVAVLAVTTGGYFAYKRYKKQKVFSELTHGQTLPKVLKMKSGISPQLVHSESPLVGSSKIEIGYEMAPSREPGLEQSQAGSVVYDVYNQEKMSALSPSTYSPQKGSPHSSEPDGSGLSGLSGIPESSRPMGGV